MHFILIDPGVMMFTKRAVTAIQVKFKMGADILMTTAQFNQTTLSHNAYEGDSCFSKSKRLKCTLKSSVVTNKLALIWVLERTTWFV